MHISKPYLTCLKCIMAVVYSHTQLFTFGMFVNHVYMYVLRINVYTYICIFRDDQSETKFVCFTV